MFFYVSMFNFLKYIFISGFKDNEKKMKNNNKKICKVKKAYDDDEGKAEMRFELRWGKEDEDDFLHADIRTRITLWLLVILLAHENP